MTKLNCPICQSETSLLYKNEKDNNFQAVEGSYNWYKCTGCSSLSILPQVDNNELASYYGDSYTPFTNKFTTVDLNDKNNAISIRIKLLQSYFPDGKFRFIDVGCGNGQMLLILRQFFPESELYGIDFNIKFAAQNLKNLNINLIEGDFAAVPDGLKFDVFSSSQFMEHIQDPQAYIALIKKASKEICYSINDFPNIYSSSFKLFGRKWVHLDTPRHRILYSKKGVDILFNGFETVQKLPFGFSGAFLSSLILVFDANIQKLLQKKLQRKLYFVLSKTLDKVLPKNDKVLYIHKLKN
ncbi:MAG: class I SAM-dependent methyltransferase [Sporocytophaga sp.]|nr:class I SAM-dependent methyltransferase [Sporocytophaga sp.]